MSVEKPTAFVSEIAGLLAQEHRTVRSLVGRVLSVVKRFIPFDLGCIALAEGGEGERLVVRDPAFRVLRTHYLGLPTQAGLLKVGGEELPQQERSFIGYVAHTRQPRRSGDVRGESFYLMIRPDVMSELAVPLLLDEELVGVINLESCRPNFYAQEQQDLLQEAAGLIARPLDGLMSREGLRAPFPKFLDKVGQLLDAVPFGLPFEKCDVLNDATEAVAQCLHSGSCTIWLLDDSGSTLILRGAYGPHRPFVNQHKRKRGPSLAWRAIQQRCPVNLPPGYPRDRRGAKSDVEVYGRALTSPRLIAPLLCRGQPLGVIKVGMRKPTPDNPEGCYSDADEAVLQVLQGRIASAVELKRLETDRRRQAAEHLTQLLELEVILQEIHPDRALRRAVLRIPKLCSGRFCSIFLWDDSRRAYVLRASNGFPREQIGKAYYLPGEGLTGWVALKKRSLILDRHSPAYLAEIDPDLKWKEKYKEGPPSLDFTLRPFLAVPIIVEGRSEGVIRVSDRKEGCFTESDEHLLDLVAQHIAANLSRARLLRQRVEVLEKLQPAQQILTQSLPTLGQGLGASEGGIDAFVRRALDEATRGAAEVLNTDVLTLHRFDAERQGFDTPPLSQGRLYQPQFMQGPVHKDDVVWKIVENGSRYWRNARRAVGAKERVPSRDGLESRPRFVIREQIVSSAGIQLRFGPSVVGVLFLNFRSPQHFDRAKRQIIESFATQMATTLEIARLYRKLRRLASLEGAQQQAEYLAQELHDALLHVLAWSVVGKASAAKDLLRMGDIRGAAEALSVVENAAKYCRDECQGIMEALPAPIAGEVGLIEQLERLKDVMGHPGLQLHLPPSDGPLPLGLKIQLLRVAQAALANADAHAQARRIEVSLAIHDRHPAMVELVVKDNGIGFDPEAVTQQPGKYGLRGIKKRAGSLGGTAHIEAAPGRGTTITVLIPLQGGAHA